MHERKFVRKGKANTAAVSLEKKLYTQFTINHVLEKLRERVGVTGKYMTLRQDSSPEQSLAKKFIAPSYFNTNRQGVCYFTEIHENT